MLQRTSIQSAAVARSYLFRTRTATNNCTKWRQRPHHCFSSAASPSNGDDTNEDNASLSTSSVDFFDILNIPRRFSINDSEIKSNYRRLMNELHPDKHTTGKSMEERQQIEDQASQVTQAYQVLKYPHERAMHLLQLVEHPMEETSNGDLVGGAFLMEMMELRESIDSLVANESDSDSESGITKKLKDLVTHTKDEISKLCDELDIAFQAENYDTAIELTAKLQYWNRIEETINEKL